MTELAGGSHIAPDDGPDRPDSIGPALPGIDCRVVAPLAAAARLWPHTRAPGSASRYVQPLLNGGSTGVVLPLCTPHRESMIVLTASHGRP
jgi:hypothetical protein